ncbi:MAG: hypothetical protein QOE92_2631 [Chloroflexota bacterium]|nr:hypothetical protein [Chloroflexota bacterium]
MGSNPPPEPSPAGGIELGRPASLDPGAPAPGLDPGILAPPFDAAAPAPPRRRRGLAWGLIGFLGLIAVVGGLFAAYQLVLASGDREVSKVPDDATVYVAVFIDPPLLQKAALLNIVKKFPKGDTEQGRDEKLNEQMDKAFKDTGLSFKDDIKPWLGGQVSFEAKVDSLANGTTGPAAFLVASKDDKLAAATLDKAREHSKDYEWTKTTHDGVDVWVGKRKPPVPSSGSSGGTTTCNGSSCTTTFGPTSAGSTTSDSTQAVIENAYAVVDGTVVLGSSQVAVEAVIDTAHGKHGRLSDSEDYKNVEKKLTTNRLVSGYINFPRLAEKLKNGSGTDGLPDSVKNQLDAVRPLGFTIAAKDDTLVAQVAGDLDSSKLDEETRQALTGSRHTNAMLGSLPADAFGAFGGTGIKKISKQLADSSGAFPPDFRDTLDRLGLSDPNGPLSHLGPDYAVSIDDGKQGPYFGLVTSTDDEVGTTQLLDKLAELMTSKSNGFGSASGSASGGATLQVTPSSPIAVPPAVKPTPSVKPTPGVRAAPRPSPPPSPQFIFPSPYPLVPAGTAEQYKSVTIKTLTPSYAIPDHESSTPAYAVVSGEAIVGSAVEEVKKLIDAQDGGSNITGTDAWKRGAAASPDLGATFFFLNFDTIRPAIERSISSEDRDNYDRDTAPYLKPLKALMASGKSDANGYTEQVVLVFQ